MASEELQLLRLVRAFAKIKDPQQRRAVVEFAEALINDETPREKPRAAERAAE